MILTLLLCCPSITVAETCGTKSLNDDLSLLQVDLAAVSSDSVEIETKSEMEEEKEQDISTMKSTDDIFITDDPPGMVQPTGYVMEKLEKYCTPENEGESCLEKLCNKEYGKDESCKSCRTALCLRNFIDTHPSSLLQVDLAAVSDSVEIETKSEMEKEIEQGISNKKSTDDNFITEETLLDPDKLKEYCTKNLKPNGHKGQRIFTSNLNDECNACTSYSCVWSAKTRYDKKMLE